MNGGLLFVLTALTAYRAWHLVARDSIAGIPRGWLTMKSTKAVDFVLCPWCLGFYISGGVVWAVDALVGVPLPVLWWAATSAVVGLIGERE